MLPGLRLGVGVRIGRRSDDGAGGGAEHQARAGIARTGDNGAENGAADRRPPPYPHPADSRAGRPRARTACASGRLGSTPVCCTAQIVAFVAIAVGLLGRLPVGRIDEDLLRRWRRRRRHRDSARRRRHAGANAKPAASSAPARAQRRVEKSQEMSWLTNLQTFIYNALDTRSVDSRRRRRSSSAPPAPVVRRSAQGLSRVYEISI